jgi:hypothetical protein
LQSLLQQSLGPLQLAPVAPHTVDTPGDEGLTEPAPGRGVEPSSDDGEHATTIAATVARQNVKVDLFIGPT